MTAIPREPGHCFICGVELHGGLDTYGEPGYERCADCFIHDPELQPYGGGLRMAVNAEGQLVTYLLVDEDGEAIDEDDDFDDLDDDDVDDYWDDDDNFDDFWGEDD